MPKTWWMNNSEHEAYMELLSRMRKLLTEHRALIGKIRNKKATAADLARLIQVIAEHELTQRQKRDIERRNPILPANVLGTQDKECLPGVEVGDAKALHGYLRLLIKSNKIADIIPAVDVFIQHCEANAGLKKAHVMSQFPGLFSANYFPQLGREFMGWFFKWSSENQNWGDSLKSAATTRKLQAAIATIVTQVNEYAREHG